MNGGIKRIFYLNWNIALKGFACYDGVVDHFRISCSVVLFENQYYFKHLSSSDLAPLISFEDCSRPIERYYSSTYHNGRSDCWCIYLGDDSTTSISCEQIDASQSSSINLRGDVNKMLHDWRITRLKKITRIFLQGYPHVYICTIYIELPYLDYRM